MKNSVFENRFEYISILIGFVSFTYLWGIKFEYFQARYLIIISLIPLFFSRLLFDFKNSNFKIYFYFLGCLFLISLHLLINNYWEDQTLTNHSLFGLFFFYIIFFLVFFYYEKIISIFHDGIKVFLILFILSSILGIINNNYDAPFFCGGIPDIFNFFTHEKDYIDRIGTPYKISFSEYIFNENSHLGMIAPGIIIYGVYYVINGKDFFFKILLFIFFIICLIKSSTTLLVGTIISSLIILFFLFKKLNPKIKIITFLIILLFGSQMYFSKDCKSRLVPVYNTGQFDDNKIYLLNQNLSENISKSLNVKGNLSSAVYFHNLVISIKSIKEKPFGWGLNRYEYAVNYFNAISPPKNKILLAYNNKDGVNNFNKIIVEFGLFGFLFFLILLLYICSPQIPVKHKMFFLPIIITQMIRGAGYFNGGFILIALIIVIEYLNRKNENLNNNTMF